VIDLRKGLYSLVGFLIYFKELSSIQGTKVSEDITVKEAIND